MRYQVFGQDFQILNVWIEPGEKLLSEAGAMVYLSGNVKMNVEAESFLSFVLRKKPTFEGKDYEGVGVKRY